MDFFEVVHTQRSIRRFKPDPVPPEAIRKMIDAAIRAPRRVQLPAVDMAGGTGSGQAGGHRRSGAPAFRRKRENIEKPSA